MWHVVLKVKINSNINLKKKPKYSQNTLRLYPHSSPSNKFTGKNNYMIWIHYYRHDELIKERFLFASAKFVFFTFTKKIPCPLF